MVLGTRHYVSPAKREKWALVAQKVRMAALGPKDLPDHKAPQASKERRVRRERMD
jgi:hypothetical protein